MQSDTVSCVVRRGGFDIGGVDGVLRAWWPRYGRRVTSGGHYRSRPNAGMDRKWTNAPVHPYLFFPFPNREM
eukprot:6768711-Pyramimonas_sp.AAC.1